MPKRERGESFSKYYEQGRLSKRTRHSKYDAISVLPEEILLRILSLLPTQSLLLTRQISRRFQILGNDSQIWKQRYYLDFVRPRAARIPGIKRDKSDTRALLFSSKLSRWLEDERHAKDPLTDWKSRYKLRHNWAKGICDIARIEVDHLASSLSGPLVRICGDIIVTVSSEDGIRAWTVSSGQLLASHTVRSGESRKLEASSLDVAPTNPHRDQDRCLVVAVGFSNGQFGLFWLAVSDNLSKTIDGRATIDCVYMHEPSSNGPVTAITYTSSGYIATMNDAQLLTLYAIDSVSEKEELQSPPKMLSSLRSHTAWPPLCLSVRVHASGIVASVAYALPTYLSGWTVGLQEIRLTPDGNLASSRLASATQQGYNPLSSTSSDSWASDTDSQFGSTIESRLSKPTSLSYSHPYLLASHTDNTLTLYLAHSSDSSLSIGPHQRLWGHTSSVSDVQIGDRGRAISVSALGGEIRIWELEGFSRKGKSVGESGIEVRPRPSRLEEQDRETNPLRTLRGVGLDEERILLVQKELEGRQHLVVYDFKGQAS